MTSVSSITNKITWQGVVAGIIIGIVLAPQVRRVPGISKLPTL
jgi:hypothetical protein